MASRTPPRTMPLETIGMHIAALPAVVDVGRISRESALHIIDPITGTATCGWTRTTTRRLRHERSIAPDTLPAQRKYCRRCWERYSGMARLLNRKIA